MHRLKWVAVLAHENLLKNFVLFGYKPVLNTDSVWQHKQNPTKNWSYTNNFGVKYFNKIDF